jgi:hypothetical protein
MILMLKNSQQPSPSSGHLIIALLWLFAALYTYILLFSPPNQLIPGFPVWAIQPETLTEITHESLNFFFVLPLLNTVGIHLMESPSVPPVLEAIFNLAEAWIFMFLPLLLADPKGRHLPRIFIWSCAMFLTNVFLIPYMAMRLQKPQIQESDNTSWIGLSRAFGFLGLIVGITAIIWGFIGHPEWGNLEMRLDYLIEQWTSNRVAIAFTVDLILFWLFQSVLLEDIMTPNHPLKGVRSIPFFGLVLWLIWGQENTEK